MQCGVPYVEIWDVFHEMYESQVSHPHPFLLPLLRAILLLTINYNANQIPPFNEQANVQTVSSDIAVLLSDWLDDVKRPQSAASRSEFPVYRIDQAVDQYLAELEVGRTETKAAYESVKRQLRRDW